jgi:hypothetical protein
MCDKLGGEKGQTLHGHIEKISAKGNAGGFTGQFNARLDEEMSDEEFAAALLSSETTLRHMEEWAKLPPVKTWDQRN